MTPEISFSVCLSSDTTRTRTLCVSILRVSVEYNKSVTRLNVPLPLCFVIIFFSLLNSHFRIRSRQKEFLILKLKVLLIFHHEYTEKCVVSLCYNGIKDHSLLWEKQKNTHKTYTHTHRRWKYISFWSSFVEVPENACSSQVRVTWPAIKCLNNQLWRANVDY